jgi:hypothetical protein
VDVRGATGAAGAGTGDLVAANNLGDVANTATARSNLGAAAKGQTDSICGVIETPANKDYRLWLNIPFGIVIVKVTTRSSAGTATATAKINTTALGGTANSVSTSEQSQTHSSSNTASTGDDIVLTVSSNLGCTDLAFNIEFTRTLS